MSNIAAGILVCRGCGGWQHNSRQADGRPWGWYQVSIAVPEYMGKRGAPYVWAGTWCSAACLAGSMADLQTQESLARTAYDPDPPLSGRWPGRDETEEAS